MVKNERIRTAAGCGSTGFSPRPMLVGAARNALWAFNARVSLTCLVRPRQASRHARPAARCGSLAPRREVMAHRLSGSAQTECVRLPYTAPEASLRAFFFKERSGYAPGPGNRERERNLFRAVYAGSTLKPVRILWISLVSSLSRISSSTQRYSFP